MVCGRCGGELYDAGSEEGYDWYVCYECSDVTCDYNPVYNFEYEAQVQSPALSYASKKKRKWFNP